MTDLVSGSPFLAAACILTTASTTVMSTKQRRAYIQTVSIASLRG